MAVTSLPLVEPLLKDVVPRCALKVFALCFLLVGFGVSALLSQLRCSLGGGGQYMTAGKPAIKMFMELPQRTFATPSGGVRPLAPTSARMARVSGPTNKGATFGLVPPVRNFIRPAAYRRHEDPFEPFFWHFAQPERIRRPENPEENNFDLWPRQESPQGTQPEEESSDLFPGRNPFQGVREPADLPRGRYVSRSFASKSHVGPDGKVVTERYASSAVGNSKERIHEAKHLYSNSSSGIEKASHEQHINGRSRMAVTDYDNGKQRESNQIFHGMNETGNEDFGEEFDMNTKHLPDRAKLSRDALQLLSHRSRSRPRALGYGNRHVANLFDYFD